ncbi:MAG: AzlD domain-containing protein [Pseudomonadota bacterium]
MTLDHWFLIATLAASTIALRALGYIAGSAMMESPFWRRVLDVFPGCLVTALVASALANGGTADFSAAAAALAVAAATRNIILTMLAGMAVFVATGALL